MSIRPTPEHGTRACYLRGCRQPECRNAHRAYCKRYRNKTFNTGALREDAQTAARHCRKLAAQGWSERQIAQAADCDDRLIHNLLHGISQKVNPGITNKILSARPQDTGEAALGLVDATGTIRRAQALVALGYQMKDIGAAINMTAKQISRTLQGHHPYVHGRTAQGMAEIYETWSKQPGPCGKTRRTAAQRGWHGPEAWDDDIDDPQAQPNAELHLSAKRLADERLADIVRLASAGTTPEQIAARTGLSRDYVRDRLKAERPITLLELTA